MLVMNDIRIQEIINESIDDLLISEGFFQNNQIKQIKQIINVLSRTLSSMNKGVSLNNIAFKVPNQQTQQQQSQAANLNNVNGNTNTNNNNVQESKGNRGRNKKQYQANLQQQRQKKQQQVTRQPQQQFTRQPLQQPQQQLTPQQQQASASAVQVSRLWSWGKQIIQETITLLQKYLQSQGYGGVKESRIYEDANGTMVNPMQIFRSGWQSGKNGFMRGYRQGYNLINNYRNFMNQLESMKNANKPLEENINEYYLFCEKVNKYQNEIEIVAENIVLGEEIKEDIQAMINMKSFYDELKNLKMFKNTNWRQQEQQQGQQNQQQQFAQQRQQT